MRFKRGFNACKMRKKNIIRYFPTFGQKDASVSSVNKKVKVSHSLIAVGAVGVRVPLYLGHS